MAALPPAVLAHARPGALAAVLGSALPSSPRRDEHSRGSRTKASHDPGHLRQRFARGEIDATEFEERKRTLGG